MGFKNEREVNSEAHSFIGRISKLYRMGEKPKVGPKTLYNYPVSDVIDYFAVNLGDGTTRVDIESGGSLKYKLKAKVEENEEAAKTGSEFEPITAEWMFSTLGARHCEPAGQPITRITNQLGNLNTVMRKELGLG